jgi:hypothetical protein
MPPGCWWTIISVANSRARKQVLDHPFGFRLRANAPESHKSISYQSLSRPTVFFKANSTAAPDKVNRPQHHCRWRSNDDADMLVPLHLFVYSTRAQIFLVLLTSLFLLCLGPSGTKAEQLRELEWAHKAAFRACDGKFKGRKPTKAQLEWVLDQHREWIDDYQHKPGYFGS